jgi:hypothetical protein
MRSSIHSGGTQAAQKKNRPRTARQNSNQMIVDQAAIDAALTFGDEP